MALSDSSRMNHDIRQARKRRKSRKQAISHPHPLLRHVLSKSMDEKKKGTIPTNPNLLIDPNYLGADDHAPVPEVVCNGCRTD